MEYKYIVVAFDKRNPPNLGDGEILHIGPQEFYDLVTSDDGGIDVADDGIIYVNVDSVTEELYRLLTQDNGFDIPIIWYRYDDQEKPFFNFVFQGKVKVYQLSRPKVEEQSTEVISEPIAEPVQEVAQEPIENAERSEVEPQEPTIVETENNPFNNTPDIKIIDGNNQQNQVDPKMAMYNNWEQLMKTDVVDLEEKVNKKPARVILFGSSKGGTGKTFTCLLSAYRYAKTHPTEKIALADFDIIDGQVGITLGLASPTMFDYYKQFKVGNDTFEYLSNFKTKNQNFVNVDFYLAPPVDNPEVTNNEDFWNNVFELLINNYDVVFFDSGIDYLGKPPISKLYKIADKILLTSNTSVNSVKSIIKQMITLSGKRKNNVFMPEDRILDRLFIILTRAADNPSVNTMVVNYLQEFRPIIAAFGDMDEKISRSQWYQQWDIWDTDADVQAALDMITSEV